MNIDLIKAERITMKKTIKFLLALLVIVAAITLLSEIPVYAAKAKLNKKSVTLEIGQKVKLKVTGTTKKVTWSTSDNKVATVNSKGKITAKGEGTCEIIAKIKSKKLICKVTIKPKTQNNKYIVSENEILKESLHVPLDYYTRENLPESFSSEEELVEWFMDRQYRLYMKPVFEAHGFNLIDEKELIQRTQKTDWDSFWYEYYFTKDNTKIRVIMALRGAQYIDALNANEYLIVRTIEFKKGNNTTYEYDGLRYDWPEEGFEFFLKYF